MAARGDALQYELDEGPCLDAVWEHHQVASPDLTAERRWPTWAPRVAREVGARSMLCTRLYTHADTLGALNIYSARPDAFDVDLRDEILAFAAHAAVAVADAKQIDQLNVALDRRTKIGIAIGVVMTRFDLDEGAALAVLKRLSSHTNRKLFDLAVEITETGRLPQSQRQSQQQTDQP